jgi:hypothetical protein
VNQQTFDPRSPEYRAAKRERLVSDARRFALQLFGALVVGGLLFRWAGHEQTEWLRQLMFVAVGLSVFAASWGCKELAQAWLIVKRYDQDYNNPEAMQIDGWKALALQAVGLLVGASVVFGIGTIF